MTRRTSTRGIQWDRLTVEEWQAKMEQLMAKPTKPLMDIRVAEFLKTTKPLRIQTQQVIQFFDPLPAEYKREAAEKFSAYLDRLRRERKRKAAPAKKAPRRAASSGR